VVPQNSSLLKRCIAGKKKKLICRKAFSAGEFNVCPSSFGQGEKGKKGHDQRGLSKREPPSRRNRFGQEGRGLPLRYLRSAHGNSVNSTCIAGRWGVIRSGETRKKR